jgi:hypothetical protein
MTAGGSIHLEWLPTGTWRALQAALLQGPWHVFHFIGHGGFDKVRGEGFVYLSDENGRAARMSAANLGRLLGDHEPMRLAVLNSCEGASGDDADVFSSTAAALVQRGTPGVIAMQYPITDRAAIEFSRSFYDAVAGGSPVDTALAVARKSISFEVPDSLEWGTPALFLRAPDGVLFKIDKSIATPHLDEAHRHDDGKAEPPQAPEQIPSLEMADIPAAAARATPVMATAAPVVTKAELSSGSSAPGLALSAIGGLTLGALLPSAWRSGHIQTLIGSITALSIGFLLGGGIYDDVVAVAFAAACWLIGAGVAGIALRLTSRPGVRATVLAMALLTPVVVLLRDSIAILPFAAIILALVARTFVLWRLGRTQTGTT